MVGMTDNTILLLGFRKVDEWTRGLSEDHPVMGDSDNTGEMTECVLVLISFVRIWNILDF